MGGNPGVRHLWLAAVKGMGSGRWAHGVMVSRTLSMLGPLVQSQCVHFGVRCLARVAGHAGAITKYDAPVPRPCGAICFAVARPLA